MVWSPWRKPTPLVTDSEFWQVFRCCLWYWHLSSFTREGSGTFFVLCHVLNIKSGPFFHLENKKDTRQKCSRISKAVVQCPLLPVSWSPALASWMVALLLGPTVAMIVRYNWWIIIILKHLRFWECFLLKSWISCSGMIVDTKSLAFEPLESHAKELQLTHYGLG